MAEQLPPFFELPELMLSLRSFGSRRGASLEGGAGSVEQERYFEPLLAARRQAATAVSYAQVVSAFDGRRILALLDATLRAFAVERFATQAPQRRAFEAELFETAEPFRQALQLLRERARMFEEAEAVDQHDPWSAWLTQLRATFRIADDSWLPLRSALDAARAAGAKPRARWRRRGGGSP